MNTKTETFGKCLRIGSGAAKGAAIGGAIGAAASLATGAAIVTAPGWVPGLAGVVIVKGLTVAAWAGTGACAGAVAGGAIAYKMESNPYPKLSENVDRICKETQSTLSHQFA